VRPGKSVFANPGSWPAGRSNDDSCGTGTTRGIQGIVLMFRLLYVLVNLMVVRQPTPCRPEGSLLDRLDPPATAPVAAGVLVVAGTADLIDSRWHPGPGGVTRPYCGNKSDWSDRAANCCLASYGSEKLSRCSGGPSIPNRTARAMGRPRHKAHPARRPRTFGSAPRNMWGAGGTYINALLMGHGVSHPVRPLVGSNGPSPRPVSSPIGLVLGIREDGREGAFVFEGPWDGLFFFSDV